MDTQAAELAAAQWLDPADSAGISWISDLRIDEYRLRTRKKLMLRNAVTIAVVICLGAHCLLGCCLQHLSLAAVNEAAREKQVVQWRPISHTCCNHEHSDHNRSESPSPCKCECRQTCNFLETSKVIYEPAGSVGMVSYLAPVEILSTSLASEFCQQANQFVKSAAQPLRSHLMHQVLLV